MMNEHIKLTGSDGKPLLVLFILNQDSDAEEVRADLANHLNVLKAFAAAWNSGEKDINQQDPVSDSVPCDVLVFTKPVHVSTFSQTERTHITVKPASNAIWDLDPHRAKGVVHVYCKDDLTSSGYESYKLQSSKNDNFSSPNMRDAIEACMATECAQ